MSIRRYAFYFSPILLAAILFGLPAKSRYFRPQNQSSNQEAGLIVGRNVNMVSGTGYINGDPFLQRQNEPSMAVSTRNPLHLMAGANDYRTVDMPISEGPLPGIPEGAAAGDAWLGLFKSFNGGESWISMLLPGHPTGQTVAGRTSPLYGFSAASDPTVRAGANGLFYYSGIAFDRVFHGRSVIFVARLIDNNVTKTGDADPIKYLDATIIDQGTSGQFADKPWIAVDEPRNGSGTVPIYTPDTPVQLVARHNVYMAYSIFLGSLQGGDQSKIMFARSADCGTTWQSPIKVSESQHINQGTTIAVSPQDGKIYLAWRRFASKTEPSAIMMCQSKDFGYSFTKAIVVAANIKAFDQYSAPTIFRTYAFPTLAVDENGIVYVAWSERGIGPGGDARIVMATSTNGVNWIGPSPIDNHGGRGHQIMPSLTYAAGRLRMTWYDTRNSEGNSAAGGNGSDISDPGPSGKPHTIDVWVAQAPPSSTPTFTDSIKISKYLHWMESHTSNNATIVQKEANHPNYKLFDGGNKPFMGDYIDIAPAPVFLYDDFVGRWRFNTRTTDPATSFITWTDNRDVRPPSDGNWTLYNPPTAQGSTIPCSDGTRTGMRNQNIYSSHITQGIMIGAPVNTKPLITYKRTFLVFVKNLTEGLKHIRLTIESPTGMEASFWESGPPAPDKCEKPFTRCDNREVDVDIDPYSSITLAVFVQPYENPYATFRVKVQEINGNFVDSVVLNPDPVNTQIVPVAEEYHTPDMMVESPALVNFIDPTVLSEEIVYIPNLSYILENVNPDIVAPTFRSPTFRSGNIVNPTFRSSSIGDISGGKVTDLQWRIKNNNDATSAYSFVPIGDPPTLPDGGAYQLLIYRVSTTPASGVLPIECALFEEEHHELLLKVESPTFRSPTFRSPTFRSPTFRSPTFRSNTFSLAPGEEAVCTLRFIEPPAGSPSQGGRGTGQNARTLKTAGISNGFNPDEYAKTVGAAAVSQAFNPDGQIPFAASLYVIDKVLPVAWVNDPYGPAFLEAYGGKPFSIDNNQTPNNPDDDIWKYDGHWTGMPILYPSTSMPSGLFVDVNGNIYGTPIYDSALTYPQVLSFIAAVTDNSSPTAQTAKREVEITIDLQYHTITATAAAGGTIAPSGEVKVPHGSNATFDITPNDCFHVTDVIVDNGSKGPLTTYTFTDVRDKHTIKATFALNEHAITTAAVPPEGGTISPSGPVLVYCGTNQAFAISPKEGYLLEDVIVDNLSQGAVTPYAFINVRSNHTITAKFKPLESWVKRYNNDSMNGDDEARAIAVNSSGNVYVTGYSTGRTTGADYYTISYNGDGIQSWSARYDGPAQLGDYANGIAVYGTGNVYIAGYGYRGNVTKHSDYGTLKYDNSGKLVWDAQYDDRRNGNDAVTAMAVGKDGFVYITGKSEDSLTKTDVKHYDYYTIKYNPSTGKVVWEARYDNNIKGADEATAIAVDGSGNVYVTGRSQGSTTSYDYATIKYDANGVQQWVKRYDNVNLIDEAAAIALDSLGNVYVTGRSQGSATGFDYVTIKYALNSPNGNPEWVQRYDSTSLIDEATAIALDSLGNVYVTGKSQGSNTGFDYLTIKYDSAGNLVWRARYNNKDVNGADEAAAIALDSEGNVYVTGRSQGGPTGLDYATVKYKQ